MNGRTEIISNFDTFTIDLNLLKAEVKGSEAAEMPLVWHDDQLEDFTQLVQQFNLSKNALLNNGTSQSKPCSPENARQKVADIAKDIFKLTGSMLDTLNAELNNDNKKEIKTKLIPALNTFLINYQPPQTLKEVTALASDFASNMPKRPQSQLEIYQAIGEKLSYEINKTSNQALKVGLEGLKRTLLTKEEAMQDLIELDNIDSHSTHQSRESIVHSDRPESSRGHSPVELSLEVSKSLRDIVSKLHHAFGNTPTGKKAHIVQHVKNRCDAFSNQQEPITAVEGDKFLRYLEQAKAIAEKRQGKVGLKSQGSTERILGTYIDMVKNLNKPGPREKQSIETRWNMNYFKK